MIFFTSFLLFLIYLNVPALAVTDYGMPVIVGVALPLLLLVPIVNRVVRHGEAVRFPAFLYASLILMLWHLISALASDFPQLALSTVTTWLLEGVVIAMLIVNAIRTREEVMSALRGLVVAGAVMGFVAVLYQFLGPSDSAYLGLGKLQDASFTNEAGVTSHRFSGPIGETNRFAQVMAVLLPIAAGFAISNRSRSRFLYWGAALLITAGMIFTYSRGTVVALVLAVPFAIAMRMVKPFQVALVSVFAVGTLLFLPYYFDRVVSIGRVVVESLAPTGDLRGADGAVRGRLTEMQAAGMMFAEHPLLGVGPGLAPQNYASYAIAVGGKVRPGTRRSHSLYLDLAAETGVIGVILFGVVIWILMARLDRARRTFEQTDRPFWGPVCGLELGFIILLFTSLFLHAAYVRYMWLVFAFVAAAGACKPAVSLSLLLHQTLARAVREAIVTARARQ